MIRLNLGSANLKKHSWINIDNNPEVKPDLVADVLDLSQHFQPESVDEVYAGHLIEHLYPQDVDRAVEHWRSLLKPGGILAVVTPDIRVLAKGYLEGAITLYELNNLYLYSYSQQSHHRWMWDQESLIQLLEKHGFRNLKIIDRLADPRLAYPEGWQCGVQGHK